MQQEYIVPTLKTDQVLGALTLLRKDGARYPGKQYWLCRCACGSTKSIAAASLNRGLSRSCGCVRNAKNRVRSLSHGNAKRSGKSFEYAAWSRMIDRCENPKNPGFQNYGGRGIVVCKRWRISFESFLADVGPRPTSSHSLDRLDTNLGYGPKNCRWATKAEQSANTRRSKLWVINGQTFQTCTIAASAFGVQPSTIMRWCDGFTQGGRRFPPRRGCSSSLKYEVI